ncbi:MAG: hypothetical protein AAB592_04525 [Patescibacteria group bacterium]
MSKGPNELSGRDLDELESKHYTIAIPRGRAFMMVFQHGVKDLIGSKFPIKLNDGKVVADLGGGRKVNLNGGDFSNANDGDTISFEIDKDDMTPLDLNLHLSDAGISEIENVGFEVEDLIASSPFTIEDVKVEMPLDTAGIGNTRMIAGQNAPAILIASQNRYLILGGYEEYLVAGDKVTFKKAPTIDESIGGDFRWVGKMGQA